MVSQIIPEGKAGPRSGADFRRAMSVELVRLSPDSADVPALKAVNEEAFPDEERLPVGYLFNGLEGMRQDMLGIYADGGFAGFLSIVVDARCAYIGYFAIRADARGHGLGGQALRLLREHYPDRQIIVDFEAPDDRAANNAQRLRRRDFYLRGGFHPTGYYQYYMDTEFEIACSSPDYDRAAYEALLAQIHARVPEFDPKHYRKDERSF